MLLEDYLDFERFDTPHGQVERIRVKGTRVAIEHLIDAFQQGQDPASIHASYPSVELEQVYAALTYYLHNKGDVDAYIERVAKWSESAERDLDSQPLSPVAQKLRRLAAERDAKSQAS